MDTPFGKHTSSKDAEAKVTGAWVGCAAGYKGWKPRYKEEWKTPARVLGTLGDQTDG